MARTQAVKDADVALPRQVSAPGVPAASRDSAKISSKSSGWGGPRANSGGARPNSGGARPGAGRPRTRLAPRPVADLLVAGPAWYCFHAFYPIEVAEAALTAEGFAVFVPRELVRIERIKSGRRIVEDARRPLFGPYGFVRLDLADPAWRRAAHTDGVRRIFGPRPERPTALPDGAVESLLVRSAELGWIDSRPQALRLAALQVGTRVRLVEGPLADVEAIVEMSTAQRVRLLLGAMRVEADRADVVEV